MDTATKTGINAAKLLLNGYFKKLHRLQEV